MAAAPNLPLVTVDEYLNTAYPDGDREYLDGEVAERNLGTPGHSALQKILIVHLAAFEGQFGLAIRPECRTQVAEARYRVPDILVMKRPFRQTDQVVLDPPLIIVEILSPDDRTQDTIRRFREYEVLGVPHILQMDPEDRTTFVFKNGNLLRQNLMHLEIPGGRLPFDTTDLLGRLDRE